MIQLTKADFEKMLAHAEKELPDEACGLIAGEVQGTDKIIKKVYLLTNIDHSNEHFSLDLKEQLAAGICVPTDWCLWETGILIRSLPPVRPKRTSAWPMTARQAT